MTPAAAQSLPSRPREDGVLGTPSSPKSFGSFHGDLADDVYNATLTDMEEQTSISTFPGPGFGKPRIQVLWLFTVEGYEDRGLLARSTSYSLHPKSNLPETSAALGLPAVDGKPIAKADYVGRKCRVVVEHEDGKAYPKIVKMMAAKA